MFSWCQTTNIIYVATGAELQTLYGITTRARSLDLVSMKISFGAEEIMHCSNFW